MVTWGRAESGGDSSRVADQLSSGVKSVVGNVSAFAAVKIDGSVVTWGAALSGKIRCSKIRFWVAKMIKL